jgi:phosphopantothenoylcysteine decarboxylase/phosphopantothenate--cysteine ligase
VLVTAGPTREHFDPVRFISNASSGRMGYAIALAAVRAGHSVTVVSGPVVLPPPPGVRVVRVTSAEEMLAASRRAFRRADAAVFTAAVSDYRPLRRTAQKAAKSSHVRRVELAPTVDIAATLGRAKGRRVTIGFALEDHAGRAHAEQKLRAKRFDAIVLNGPGNIGSDRARADFLVRGGSWRRWGMASKDRLARRIVAAMEALAAARR